MFHQWLAAGLGGGSSMELLFNSTGYIKTENTKPLWGLQHWGRRFPESSVLSPTLLISSFCTALREMLPSLRIRTMGVKTSLSDLESRTHTYVLVQYLITLRHETMHCRSKLARHAYSRTIETVDHAIILCCWLFFHDDGCVWLQRLGITKALLLSAQAVCSM